MARRPRSNAFTLLVTGALLTFTGLAQPAAVRADATDTVEVALVKLDPGPVTPRQSDVAKMLATLNAERAAHGLAPLELDPSLCKIAGSYAMEMGSRDFFSHVSPEGDGPFDRLDKAQYHYGYAGENIALDENETLAANDLWHSPGHRDNILDTHYAKVGIGAVESADGEIFVEDFSD